MYSLFWIGIKLAVLTEVHICAERYVPGRRTLITKNFVHFEFRI